MGQGKTGWWIAGVCAVVVLLSIGYGWGKRAGAALSSSALTPAGAAPAALQIEPIQPQAELAAITVTPPQPETGITQTVSVPAASTPLAFAPAEESARVREIQRALKTAGFDPGTIDGRLGPKTTVAVRDFQRANGLEPDGKVGPRTWSKLESYLKEHSKGD